MKIRWSIIFVLVVFNLALLSVVRGESPTNKLRVVFLDVGQGDSILIEAPNKNRLLIDGGPGRGVLSSLGKELPWYKREIEGVLGTHTDSDHMAGLVSLLSHYTTRLAIMPAAGEEKELYQTLSQKIKRQEAREIKAKRGMTIDLGKGARLSILSALEGSNVSSNDSSVVAKLSYGDSSVLLMGDASTKLEGHLISRFGQGLHSELIKLAHHGSKTSSSGKFLMTVRPKSAIISVSKDNRYGLPDQEVLSTLSRLKIVAYRTDLMGNIGFVSDGKSFMVFPN